MVVPVDVALGRGTPREWRARLRGWLEKSKPGIVAVVWVGWCVVVVVGGRWRVWRCFDCSSCASVVALKVELPKSEVPPRLHVFGNFTRA